MWLGQADWNTSMGLQHARYVLVGAEYVALGAEEDEELLEGGRTIASSRLGFLPRPTWQRQICVTSPIIIVICCRCLPMLA